MKKLSKILLAFTAFSLLLLVCLGAQSQCVHVQFKPDVKAIVPKATGYAIAKNHPELIDSILGYTDAFEMLVDPGVLKQQFIDGKQWLVGKLSDDPFYQVMIQELLDGVNIEIAPDTALTGAKVEAIKKLVADFADGVKKAKLLLGSVNKHLRSG